ncbi:MAG: hypothetical protein U9R75_02475, partial [Candidatus Thermoplasmatota archaeon]|nr:hypothetical protein [Candidatus Thermoplasmatota archaeon]
MEYWNCPSRRLLLILPAAYLLILLLFSVNSSASSTAMIEIEQDSVWVDVSPGSYGTESMDATVRSSSARNVILDVHYELDAPSTWSVDGPDQLFMEPFGKKAFKVDIFVPMGELAERIGELTITATVQGEETLDIGSDSVQINIQEFRQMTPVIGSDYILDLPAEGEIEL